MKAAARSASLLVNLSFSELAAEMPYSPAIVIRAEPSPICMSVSSQRPDLRRRERAASGESLCVSVRAVFAVMATLWINVVPG